RRIVCLKGLAEGAAVHFLEQAEQLTILLLVVGAEVLRGDRKQRLLGFVGFAIHHGGRGEAYSCLVEQLLIGRLRSGQLRDEFACGGGGPGGLAPPESPVEVRKE